MDFEELINLIKIRQYVVNSVGLPTITRQTVSELNGILLLLDEKIIGILTGVPFKDYIGYSKNVQEAKKRAAEITNVFSGIKGRK